MITLSKYGSHFTLSAGQKESLLQGLVLRLPAKKVHFHLGAFSGSTVINYREESCESDPGG